MVIRYEPQIKHVGGNFYQAQNSAGHLFFGNQLKAERFMKDEYDAPVRTVFEEGPQKVFGALSDDTQ